MGLLGKVFSSGNLKNFKEINEQADKEIGNLLGLRVDNNKFNKIVERFEAYDFNSLNSRERKIAIKKLEGIVKNIEALKSEKQTTLEQMDKLKEMRPDRKNTDDKSSIDSILNDPSRMIYEEEFRETTEKDIKRLDNLIGRVNKIIKDKQLNQEQNNKKSSQEWGDE